MIDRALVVMMVMYSVSMSLLGAQYIIGDVFNITLTNFEGVAIESHLLTLIDEDLINTQSENIVNANFTTNSTYYDKVETSTTSAAYVAWELVTLLTGTYIFNFLYLMGVPLIFVVLMTILYGGFLIARAVIGYINRV